MDEWSSPLTSCLKNLFHCPVQSPNCPHRPRLQSRKWSVTLLCICSTPLGGLLLIPLSDPVGAMLACLCVPDVEVSLTCCLSLHSFRTSTLGASSSAVIQRRSSDNCCWEKILVLICRSASQSSQQQQRLEPSLQRADHRQHERYDTGVKPGLLSSTASL